jgi:hypothetical protein
MGLFDTKEIGKTLHDVSLEFSQLLFHLGDSGGEGIERVDEF